jgi:hypothetical protein
MVPATADCFLCDSVAGSNAKLLVCGQTLRGRQTQTNSYENAHAA